VSPHRRYGKPSLGAGRRRLIHGVGALLWLSGAAWLGFHYFVKVKGEFGPSPSPLEPWWLKLHGAAAFASLFIVGLLWGVHVVRGWNYGERRASGTALLVLLGALSLSGYLLYYAGSDALRAAVSLAHWIPGLALPGLYLAHRIKAARARRAVQQGAHARRAAVPPAR
jgi:hypothetical protein